MSEIDPLARSVLTAYGLEGAPLTPIESGHINRTYRVDAGERFILQRVNPIFGPEVHDDIEAVTRHLLGAGMRTPLLVKTRDGALWTRDSAGGVWRVLTFVDGHTHARLTTHELATAAGVLVGRFHAAVTSLVHDFKHRRPHVHDTPRHLANLAQALEKHRGHRNYDAVAPLGLEILERAGALPSLANLPPRIVHGDLKITNLMFAPSGEGVALVDLDTLSRMALPLELGDAFRSWCNPGGEDDVSARFDVDLFAAALRGYAVHGKAALQRDETLALPVAVETIALELAARFAADALNESYFGWDKARFASASDHNLRRAMSQVQLGRSVAEQKPALARAVAEAF